MRWNLIQSQTERVQALADELVLLPACSKSPDAAGTLARLLFFRGIETAEAASQFLSSSLAQLHSPYLMTGMKAAVDRLDAAIERKEGILVYGDYDVDGTTAVVILKTAIELCGGTADFHVPHRIREGYDLRGDVIERAAAAGIRLVISVDAGTRAFAAAESARRAGVDLIITDHHLPGADGLPHAFAVVNPNQPGCDYPCKSLCGAGIAFKVAQALMERRLPHRDAHAPKGRAPDGHFGDVHHRHGQQVRQGEGQGDAGRDVWAHAGGDPPGRRREARRELRRPERRLREQRPHDHAHVRREQLELDQRERLAGKLQDGRRGAERAVKEAPISNG